MFLPGSARVGASRRLLVEEELLGGEQQRTLGDPNPVCQFCELAVSYVKARTGLFGEACFMSLVDSCHALKRVVSAGKEGL